MGGVQLKHSNIEIKDEVFSGTADGQTGLKILEIGDN